MAVLCVCMCMAVSGIGAHLCYHLNLKREKQYLPGQRLQVPGHWAGLPQPGRSRPGPKWLEKAGAFEFP